MDDALPYRLAVMMLVYRHGLNERSCAAVLKLNWPDGFFVPAALRDYCIGAAWSIGCENGLSVCGAGGLYPSDECGLTVL
jgi:hypothetical protein